jgi:hypothetical protein
MTNELTAALTALGLRPEAAEAYDTVSVPTDPAALQRVATKIAEAAGYEEYEITSPRRTVKYLAHLRVELRKQRAQEAKDPRKLLEDRLEQEDELTRRMRLMRKN